jgi:hypothetical protein
VYVGFNSARERVSPLRLLPGERRLKNHFMSDIENKIKQYEDKLKELEVAFRDRATLRTEITVCRIFDNLQSLGERPDILRSSTLTAFC